MKCRIGVHSERITVAVSPEGYVELKRRLPAPVGRRSWHIDLAGTWLELRRSQFGTTAKHTARGEYQISNDCRPTVRCAVMDAELDFSYGNKGVVHMPPLHLWPWIGDRRSVLRDISITEYRHMLIRELNARARSATAAGHDLPRALPDWVREMLSPSELVKVLSNQEIA